MCSTGQLPTHYLIHFHLIHLTTVAPLAIFRFFGDLTPARRKHIHIFNLRATHPGQEVACRPSGFSRFSRLRAAPDYDARKASKASKPRNLQTIYSTTVQVAQRSLMYRVVVYTVLFQIGLCIKIKRF